MRDAENVPLSRATGINGSFTFDQLAAPGEASSQKSWEAGLFGARDGGAGSSLPTVGVSREDSAHAPMWRVVSQEPHSGCPPSFSFPPSVEEASRGHQAHAFQDSVAAAAGFTLHSSRRSRGGLSCSMPDIFGAGAAAPLSQSRNSRSTFDMSMDAVFSEDEVRAGVWGASSNSVVLQTSLGA